MGVHTDGPGPAARSPGPVVLPVPAVRDVDRVAAARYGLSTLVLMESAGRAVADETMAAWQRRCQARLQGGPPHAVIVAGTGQNGGDGHVAARHLAAAGWDVSVWLAGDPAKLKGDALVNWHVLGHSGIPRHWLAGAEAAPLAGLAAALEQADAVIDALLGTGFHGEARGPVADALAALHRWRQRGPSAVVIAADVPSGVDAGTGAALARAVQADVTVTFVALKPGLLLEPGRSHAGTLRVSTLGVPPATVADVLAGARWQLCWADPAALATWLPRRPVTAHKHQAGHVWLLAGAPGYSGAAVLAARAALRGGAGLVTAATAAETAAQVAAALPEAMVRPLTAAAAAGLADAAAVAAGPGLVGLEEAALQLLECAPPQQPWVLDAAVLRALAGRLDKLRGLAPERLVLTPHPGEMAGLLGCTTADVQADRLEAVQRAAEQSGAVVVLKGAPTLIAQPGRDGQPGRVCINSTGNPVLATAGSGDVLTGVIAALLAQGLGPWEAALLGVCWHGRAGDWLAHERGAAGLLAGEIGEALLPARQLLVQEGTVWT